MNTIFLDEVNSTNTYAIENLNSLPDRSFIVSKNQIKGKGRNKNIWFAPSGKNVNSSFIIKTDLPIAAQTSMIGGLAAINTLRTYCIDNLWIKWPNDVFCKRKKIAGVLCESVISSKKNSQSAIIIGIGINVNCSLEDFSGVPKPATSILIETDRNNNIRECAIKLKNELNLICDAVLQNGISSIYKQWKLENGLLGKKIVVEQTKNSTLEVKVVDLDESGALVGVDADGNIHKIWSGDVSVKQFDLGDKNEFKKFDV